MKKRIVSVAMALLCSLSCLFAGCESNESAQEQEKTPLPAGDPATIMQVVENQAHEEKAGYKFCGYFYDKELTQRVDKAFDTVPTDYYPKYQLDREQMFLQKQGTEGLNYTFPSYTLDQVIYAEDYKDAIERYLLYTYNEDRLMGADSIQKQTVYTLGENYTQFQIRGGATNEELNRVHNFHDVTNIQRSAIVGGSRYNIDAQRDINWKAYLGKASTLSNGVRYYIVDNAYAVIVGLKSETVIDSFAFPSRIAGKPVKQISIIAELNVKDLTVPGCVENAMIYLPNSLSQEQSLEKLTFQEGVRSIQLFTAQTEEVLIPSTAYFVDFHRYGYGTFGSAKYTCPNNQKITVSGGEHYYTEDGILYTTEGDLVHQFGNREKLNLTISDKASRVLRRSITGVAKNITIPQTVKYCSPFFNDGSMRFQLARRSLYNLGDFSVPAVFLNSESVVKQWLHYYELNDAMETLPYLEVLASYTVLNDNISLDLDTAMVAKYVKVDENVVYSVRLILAESGQLLIDGSGWQVYSYLNEDFPKDDLSFDATLAKYYELYAS